MILEFCVIVNRLKSAQSREINNIFLFFLEGWNLTCYSLSNTVIVPHWTSEISAQPVSVISAGSRPREKAGRVGGGSGHPEPEIREGRSPKIVFQFGLKIREVGGEGWALPPGSATGCKKGTVESRMRQTQT